MRRRIGEGSAGAGAAFGPKAHDELYTRLGVHDLATALDRLPTPALDRPDHDTLRATGTDNAAPGNSPGSSGANQRGQTRRGAGLSIPLGSHKTLCEAEKDDLVRSGAASCGKATRETRTRDLSFTKARGDSVSDSPAMPCDGSGDKPGSRPGSSTRSDPRSAELEEVIANWSRLPEAVRAGVLTMVRATQ